MSSIIIIAVVWSYASLSEILLLFWAKFRPSAKVSARLKQLVTYIAGTCGGDKVSEFARRLHVAIYKAGCHPTNRRLRIIAFLLIPSLIFSFLFLFLVLDCWFSFFENYYKLLCYRSSSMLCIRQFNNLLLLIIWQFHYCNSCCV